MYAKIFSQMYDGTLATDGPWQALVTFQQLLILADQDGVVDMTIPAIVRRTTIPREIIETGIAALMLPDPESRTPTEEGRRIVPLSEGRAWGWRIVNYAKYRQIKRETDRREYHKEYWHKRKEKSVEQHDSTFTQHDSTTQPIAEAKTKAKAKAKAPISSEIGGGQAATPPKRGRKPSEDRTLSDWIAATQEKGEFAIPENDPVYASAQAAGLSAELVQLAWFAFKRKYGPDGMSGDKKYKDWRVVFRTAVSENWAKLWMLDSLTNEFRLTTAGTQAQREFESQT